LESGIISNYQNSTCKCSEGACEFLPDSCRGAARICVLDPAEGSEGEEGRDSGCYTVLPPCYLEYVEKTSKCR
jgi:hypothetical protein